jgi:hypothetical protein
VAYDLQLSDYWQNYLENLPVSDIAKEKLSDFLEYGIASVNDGFRNDPDAARGPTSHFSGGRFLFWTRTRRAVL